MKKTLIIIALLFSSFAVSAQKHNMKYYFHHEAREWMLEEKTNYRTDSPVVSPEGEYVGPRAIFYTNRINPEKEDELVSKILLPVLPRYQSQGLAEFYIEYIILPDGSVDEVLFNFYEFRDKLNITQKDMLLWQKLSDALKRELRFVIPADAVKVKFAKSSYRVVVAEVLNPGSTIEPSQSRRTPEEEAAIRERTKRIMDKIEWVIIEDSDSED